jgi:hypothetical protein
VHTGRSRIFSAAPDESLTLTRPYLYAFTLWSAFFGVRTKKNVLLQRR